MRRTILLADDSPTIRRLVTQTFADGNYEIVAVSNGDAAIKAFEEISPSVVLADIYMPGKNGYEVCSYIRKHATLSETPVVLLVGAFDAFDEETAKEAGATANITKPFEPGALIELVRSILPPAPETEPSGQMPEPQQEAQPIAEPVSVPGPVIAIEPPVPQVQVRAPASPPPSPSASSPAPATPAVQVEVEDSDLLGLGTIFREEPVALASGAVMTEEDVDRIADRVIQRISSQVIESIAWEIVPDITERVIREELKRIDES